LINCCEISRRRPLRIPHPEKPEVSTWRFVDLINVAVETEIVSKGAEKLSHSVREYRNLVHPQKELKDKLGAV
jgi:hypothetical protein